MPDIETGQTTHTLEQIDAGISEVETAKGDFPSLAAAIAAKQDQLEFDDVPTEGSTDVMLSGGVFPISDALAYLIDTYYKRNVLQNNGNTTTVADEVTFTVAADGTVTAEVIAEKTTAARALNWYATVPAGTWFFTTGQAQSGASPAPCFAYLYENSTTIALDYGDRRAFTLASDTYLRCYIQIRKDVLQGATFVFKPMCCVKEFYEGSSKYLPYSGT